MLKILILPKLTINKGSVFIVIQFREIVQTCNNVLNFDIHYHSNKKKKIMKSNAGQMV